ncbi:diguanylate cyclase (GGDEF) domain-containing protein [Marinobacter antarcticus]|uniref:diguanylate cyclase n=1 Tax=Marinobacter antarcticus TaxID=564117 RepID=A0A1M6QK58_9GAMM|nr:GGDEF domain-containing protein [Marinobacter antarcticus]SHK20417.1 diguanylate cyclase (GGDEF) domain-containing protein [Marinobacter antarcticus]
MVRFSSLKPPYKKVPPKWLPAYEAHIRTVEGQVAIVAAWVLLITVIFYQFSHELRLAHRPDLWLTELFFRIPVLLSASLTLLSHYTGKPLCQSRYLLRAMGLSVMAMILGLFLIHYNGRTADTYQITNGMVISFFGVAILSVRGSREWWLMFALPLTIFALVAQAQGLALPALLPFMFDPLVMMIIGIVMSEALRQLRAGEFLARQQLREQATTDQLTGLLNRRAMHQLLNQEYARAKRHGATFSLILGDLDRFKGVNDRYGHNIGDIVLQETARRLGSNMRAQDALCRWGGEEILMLLPGTVLDGAMHVAEKVRRSLADDPMLAGEHSIPQTISLGVTSCHGDDDIESAIKRADDALYQAKENGRNRIEAIASPYSGHVLSAHQSF